MQTGATAAVRPRSETRQFCESSGGRRRCTSQRADHDERRSARRAGVAASDQRGRRSGVRHHPADCSGRGVGRCLQAGARLVRCRLVADIHFDYRLALAALEAGADGLRINPGNIGGSERVRAVVAAARGRHAPIRIGVNGGSLEADILAKHGSATPRHSRERVAPCRAA